MTFSGIQWLNMLIWGLASAAAFGSLNKQRWGATKPCIIGATLLIALGCAGQALGQWASQWQQIFDTATAGGLLVLLIASQRVHTWFLERWAHPVASALATAVGIVFLVGLLSGCASPQPVPECPQVMARAVVHVEYGPGMFLDAEDIANLQAHLRGARDGTCRPPAP